MALDQKKKSQNVLKYVNKQMSLLLIIFYVSQIVFCFFFLLPGGALQLSAQKLHVRFQAMIWAITDQ